MHEQSLEWIAGEMDRRVTFELYARVRRGERNLAHACELLLPAAGECETMAWRQGTQAANANALLRHAEPALAALRAEAVHDLADALEELRDEIARRAGG